MVEDTNNPNSKKNSKIMNLVGLVTGCALLAAGVGTGVYSLNNQKDQTKITKLQNQVNKLENRVSDSEKITGKPLGYVALVDFNGDQLLDKIIPYSSGSFVVEINEGEDKFRTSMIYSPITMKKLTDDYFFGVQNMVSADSIQKTLFQNPETICSLKKLILDYEFLTPKTQFDYLQSFEKIESSIPKKVNCS